jgi:hypothetical protein
MRYPKFCLSVFIFVLFVNTLSAQTNFSEGYYIGINKDTVRGFFNLDDLYYNKIVFYKTVEDRTPTVLLPDSVLQIETLNKLSIRTYVNTFQDKKEGIFVSKFADGDVALYQGKSHSLDEDELYFISSVKLPEVRKISKSNPKNFLNIYFKGCELDNFASVRYTQNSLLLAVKKISKCAYPNSEIVQNSPRKYPIKASLGFKIGGFVNFSTTEYVLGERPIKANIQPVFGAILFIDVSNNTKIYSGANFFTRQLISSDGNNQGLPNFKFSSKFIEIPIAVHYDFNQNKPEYIPKFFVGISKLIPIGSSIEDVDVSHQGSRYNIDGFYTDYPKQTSFFVGIGVKKMLKNRATVELNLKYARENEDVTEQGRINSDRFELSFAYLLPLSKK